MPIDCLFIEVIEKVWTRVMRGLYQVIWVGVPPPGSVHMGLTPNISSLRDNRS